MPSKCLGFSQDLWKPQLPVLHNAPCGPPREPWASQLCLLLHSITGAMLQLLASLSALCLTITLPSLKSILNRPQWFLHTLAQTPQGTPPTPCGCLYVYIAHQLLTQCAYCDSCYHRLADEHTVTHTQTHTETHSYIIIQRHSHIHTSTHVHTHTHTNTTSWAHTQYIPPHSHT